MLKQITYLNKEIYCNHKDANIKYYAIKFNDKYILMNNEDNFLKLIKKSGVIRYRKYWAIKNQTLIYADFLDYHSNLLLHNYKEILKDICN